MKNLLELEIEERERKEKNEDQRETKRMYRRICVEILGGICVSCESEKYFEFVRFRDPPGK